MWVALSTAAINFNDGFGGGTNASRNLLFNTCRETGGEDPCTRALSLSVRPLARRHATLLCICPDALSLSISACLSLSLSQCRPRLRLCCLRPRANQLLGSQRLHLGCEVRHALVHLGDEPRGKKTTRGLPKSMHACSTDLMAAVR